MADVSDKRIDTLTQTASQTPQFQASSDPVQGVLGAAQMGLDFYAKQQAQEQLQAIEAQQAQSQTTLAEGALGLRDLRQRLVSQGASAVKIQKEERAFLQRYDSATAFEIVGAANKVSGRNLGSTINAADDVTKDAEAKAKVRFEKEEQAAALSGFLPKPPPVNGTDEELDAYILQGTAEQSTYSAISSRAAAEMALTNNGEKKREINMRAADNMMFRFVGAQSTNLINQALTQTDLTDVTSKKDMLGQLTAQKAQIPLMVRNFYSNQSINLSTTEMQQKIDALVAPIDTALEFISGDAATKINKNALTNVMNNVLFESMSSSNPNSRAAATGVAVALGTGTPVQPNHIANLTLTGMQRVLAGDSWREANDANIATGQQQYDAARAMLPGMFKADNPELAETNYDTVVNTFTGSPEKLNSPEGKKNIAKVVESIAGAGSLLNVPEGKKSTLGGMLKQVMEPKLQATFSAFMTETQTLPIGMEGRSGYDARVGVTAKGAGAYSFNPETLEVRPTAPDQQMSARAAALNKLVKDTLKSYEVLGMDTAPLKDNIRNTFGINPEGENNG